MQMKTSKKPIIHLLCNLFNIPSHMLPPQSNLHHQQREKLPLHILNHCHHPASQFYHHCAMKNMCILNIMMSMCWIFCFKKITSLQDNLWICLSCKRWVLIFIWIMTKFYDNCTSMHRTSILLFHNWTRLD